MDKVESKELIDHPPYQHINDLMSDDYFPELDSRLRRGEHIDARSHQLFNMIRNGFHLLSEHYQRYGSDLIQAPESFYYLRPATGGKNWIRSQKLDALSMIVGQVLAMFHLDPEQLEDNGWISADAIYERMRLLLDTDYLCLLLERRKIETQADREKAMETLRRAIRTLARLGMVRLEGNQANRLQTQSPLMRFIEPVRAISSTPEATRAAMEALVTDGYISFDSEDETDSSIEHPGRSKHQDDTCHSRVEDQKRADKTDNGLATPQYESLMEEEQEA